MPILHTRLVLNGLKKGDVALILADDRGFRADFATFCYQADLKLLERQDFQFHSSFKVELLK